jgi:hypothetical protein
MPEIAPGGESARRYRLDDEALGFVASDVREVIR